MWSRVTPLAALCALLGAAVAQAHVGNVPGGAPEEANRALFAQQPWPMPAQMSQAPSTAPVPRAQCGEGDKPEPGIQGRFPKDAVDSGAAADGYWCNLTRISQYGPTGGFKTLRYVDKNGHECAYYDTALLFPTNTLNLSGELTGVAVLDMSDPANPKRTDSLLTPAMQSPHESVNISVERGVLAAVAGNPSFAPGLVDVYDISQDCRRPQLMSTLNPAGYLGHESGMAPDGRTFYATSISTGHTTAVDLTDLRNPRQIWQGRYDAHGMTLSDDGTRGYLAAGSGLIILDLTEVQQRKPNPQVREISRLVWPEMTIPQVAHPITIKGKPYLFEVDEYSGSADDGGVTAHGPRVGAARLIDISDETKPRVVSNIRLAVHNPENRDAIGGDYGARNPTQGYAAHYCGIPRRTDPNIVACSMIISGLRVFDIRDPEKPKEIAYHYAPPSTISETGGPVMDERSNWAMSQPAFVPERNEIWYSDGQAGFYALRLDEQLWPKAFPRSLASCREASGLSGVGATARGGAVSLRFTRERDLPVRVDVFRVSRGTRVVKEKLVARFTGKRGTFTWRPRSLAAGYYFARFTMLDGSRRVDTRRVVLERTRLGNFVVRKEHFRRDTCGLLGKAKLDRPTFGGSRGTALSAAYRLTSDAKVTVTISRGAKVVKRFAATQRKAETTYRVTLPSKGLRRGEYTVRIHAVDGEDQDSTALTGYRL